MAREMPTTAYTELQIDEDSVSITLLSENSDGAIVEDTQRFTFDELESLAGEHRSLHLSGETQNTLSEPQISQGDVLIDKNSPSWSDRNRVVVEHFLTEETIEYHYINEHQTVADANPSYPKDDAVVLCHYEGSDETYAFPESRLSQE